MKKSVAIIFVVILAVMMLFAGCGGSGGSAEDKAPADSTQSDQAEQAEVNADTEEMGDLLSATYADMMKNKEYLMKYKSTVDMEGQQLEVNATVAVSGDDMAVTSTGNGFETSMIVKGDKVFMIDHASKTVTSWAKTPEMESAANGDSINVDGMAYVGTGKEDGLKYEEYTVDGGTLRYYFDGKNLAKITMSAEGVEMNMEILEMSKDVPASMFEIPSGYQTVEM